MSVTDANASTSKETTARPGAPAAPSPQWLPLSIGALTAVVLVVATAVVAGAKLAVLAGLGLALGLTLFHARFGFTSAWRQLVSVRQTSGLRAHLLMLATASVLFAPILAGGLGFFGERPEGNVEPLGLSLVVGAVLFGVGMQLGGACASGTLFAVGGGNGLLVVTLFFFIVGSVLGALHMPLWSSESLDIGSFSLAEDTGLGYGGALLLQLLVLAAIWYIVTRWAHRSDAPPAGRPAHATGWWRIIRGSWPLWTGALALAVLNAAVLLTRGTPWGITSAFVLWGSKALQAVGVDVASWPYWQGAEAKALTEPLLSDATSVLNFGIMLGALVAAAASGAFVLVRRTPPKVLLAAVVGGLLMGYGARLAYGCNIGSYFSGIASFSLHGWAWGLLALGGTWLGLRLRPLFGLGVPKPTDSVC